MNKFKKGFTLIELLIYAAMFAGASALLTGMLITVLKVQTKQALGNEASSQLTFVLETVNRLVRESSLIEKVYEGSYENVACALYCSVKLRMPNATEDPTIITAKNDSADNVVKVFLKQGGGEDIPLTNNKVIVTNLNFTANVVPGGNSILNIDASLKYNSPDPNLSVARSIRSAIGRASAATFDSDVTPSNNDSLSVGLSATRWKYGFFSSGLTVGPVGFGTAITQMTVYAQSINPPSVPAESTAYQSIIITGLSVSDKVYVNPGSDFAGNCALGSVRVSAADTLRIQYINPGVSSCDTASSVWNIVAIRS